MNPGVSELVIFGLLALVAGALVLVSMVWELTSDRKRKWLLGVGLGTGVIAFGLKIILIVMISAFPEPVMELFPGRERLREPPPAASAHLEPASRYVRAGSYTWQALPQVAPAPSDNPTSPEKMRLGKLLFFDKRLSADGQVACASCHIMSLERAGTDGLPVSIGIHGQAGSRNAPTVLNAAFQEVLFWDGRARSLEEQAKGPLVNPIEMGMPSLAAVEERLMDIPEYWPLFAAAFSGEVPSATGTITIDNIAKAIAAYERTLITPDSPYDRFIRGGADALTAQQLRGMSLFESSGCVVCHSGPMFSAASVFGGGAHFRVFPAIPNAELEKKYAFSKDPGLATGSAGASRGIWRIPSLRNVSRTAPYFHNGSVDRLAEAVRVMAATQLGIKIGNNADDDRVLYWDERMKQIRVADDRVLTDQEVADMVAFLRALDGDPEY